MFCLTLATSQLSVERGDHIVPSFEEISGKSKQSNGHEAPPRRWVHRDRKHKLILLLFTLPPWERKYCLVPIENPFNNCMWGSQSLSLINVNTAQVWGWGRNLSVVCHRVNYLKTIVKYVMASLWNIMLCFCRRDTGRAYYAAAMQSHGLPGKIPSSFTTGDRETRL